MDLSAPDSMMNLKSNTRGQCSPKHSKNRGQVLLFVPAYPGTGCEISLKLNLVQCNSLLYTMFLAITIVTKLTNCDTANQALIADNRCAWKQSPDAAIKKRSMPLLLDGTKATSRMWLRSLSVCDHHL